MVVHPVEGETSDQHYSKQVRSHMVLSGGNRGVRWLTLRLRFNTDAHPPNESIP